MSKLVLHSRDGYGSGSFYARLNSSIDHEAERLQTTAIEIANPISESALMPFLRAGDSVLDIGAGADATLGQGLTANGLRYIAVEPNKNFVDILNAAGVTAHQGDVVNLPIESNSVDAVHMRFLFGWLNEEQRKAALRQSARVLEPGEQKPVTVIDYDWMETDGPSEYMEMVGVACDVLKSFGFDYQYGAKISSDVDRWVSQNVFETDIDYRVLPLMTQQVGRTLGEGMPLLEEAVSSLVEGLSAIGDAEKIRALEQALQNLRGVDPETHIFLPAVATQTILLTKAQPSVEKSKGRLELLAGIPDASDQSPTLIDGVFEARRGSETDEYVRQLQAYEYLKNGLLVSEDMIEDGVLCEASYPKKYLDRSRLFVTITEGKTIPSAAVRLIQTEPNGSPDIELQSLPTAEHLGLTLGNRGIFPEELPASGFFEISSAVRNSKESGTLLDMSKAIISLCAEAKLEGYHTAIMSTQVKTYGLLQKMFGEDNFKLIEGPHKSPIPGATDAVDFVCMSVDMRYFFERLWEHIDSTKETSKFSKNLSVVLENYYSSYSQVA